MSLSALAAGNPGSGKIKALMCGACHGNQGISPNSLWPNLAGQHAAYLQHQLEAFKSGEQRNAAPMTSIATTLNPQDMADLAAYYSRLPVAEAQPTETPSVLGEHLYRQGNPQKHIPACITCHGPDGRGNASANFPMISHQQSDYTYQQLRAFQSGDRKTDPLQIMRTIAAQLNSEEMKALAEYMAGL